MVEVRALAANISRCLPCKKNMSQHAAPLFWARGHMFDTSVLGRGPCINGLKHRCSSQMEQEEATLTS